MTSTTELKGTVKLCEDTGAVLTINKPITIGYPVNNTTLDTIGSYQIQSYNSGSTTFDLRNSLSFAQIPIVLPIGIYQCTAKCNIKSSSSQPFLNIYFFSSTNVLANGATQSGGGALNAWGGQGEGYYFNVANQETPVSFSAPVVISSSSQNRLSVVCYSDQSSCNVRIFLSVIRIG
jgi:hypothetical protein